MHARVVTFVILLGVTVSAVGEEPREQGKSKQEGKTSSATSAQPDPVPAGLVGFNGMLVGRLAAKDPEKGTFVVVVDAVPRVWRNNKAKDPKSVVGKKVEVSGVFGRFLDVLVVTRAGETVEFECKHDGERLVFPGELLRKVAAYDPTDYPPLPEAFRGFHGAVAGKILKKDPETFEMIVQVDRVIETWKNNKASNPQSIQGKPMMVAGFWNRKEVYHGLKAGDQIEVGLQHIESQSDHLTVVEFARKAGTAPAESAKPEKQRAEGPASAKPATSSRRSGEPEGLAGFRGMLVGRLIDKDIERGTFSITVDAIPRVFNNNQASRPKSLLGQTVQATGVTGKMLDALVVARPGETLEFGALSDDSGHVRVGEVLRKVAPVKPGDYPVLPDPFRGFQGVVRATVVRKDDHLLDLVVEIDEIRSTKSDSRAEDASTIVGKRAMLAGFWKQKDAYHSVGVGDRIECGVQHPQPLSDHLTVSEPFQKVDRKD